MKEQLRAILDRRQPNVVRARLESWCSWAQRSRLGAFLPLTRTIRRHMERILGYLRTRLTNGLVEGLNLKVRLLIRRAYGFHSADAIIAMVRLCFSQIELPPVRERFAAPCPDGTAPRPRARSREGGTPFLPATPRRRRSVGLRPGGCDRRRRRGTGRARGSTVSSGTTPREGGGEATEAAPAWRHLRLVGCPRPTPSGRRSDAVAWVDEGGRR